MARPPHDSQLEISPPLVPPATGPSGPDAMPTLDLTARGPLPPGVAAMLSGQDKPREPARRVSASHPAGGGQAALWLEGGALWCACPDCHAPMSVRLWLMMADCWQCGTSIELTEEQEQQAKRLLGGQGQATVSAGQPSAPKPNPAAARLGSGDVLPERPAAPPPQPPAPSPHPAKPSPSRNTAGGPGPPLPATPPVTSSASRPDPYVTLHASHDWIGSLFRDMPAWLISLVFHLVVLTLLGLLTFGDDSRPPRITLSLAVNRYVRPGDSDAWLSPDAIQLDRPLAKDRPRDDREPQLLIQAELDARRLRIDPESNDLNLPDLARVKQDITSRSDAPRRTLALRDPRVRVQLVRREGGTTLTEAAVARGLHWMAIHQQADGSWSLNRFSRHPDCRGRCRNAGRISSDAAATSLVLLPFLGAGQTHLTGYYKDVVSAGLRWLLNHQKPDGDLRADSPFSAGMYVHGQATIVLCEALAMTQDETFRLPAQKAVDFIVAAQHPRGGWRYKPLQEGDTSVLGWQLMALQSAKAAGLAVPDETLENAGYFLDHVQQKDGALYAYQPRQRPSPSMTAEGLLCRVYLSWKQDHPGLTDGVDYLLEQLPDEDHPNFYYWYYATQVMHHVGGTAWNIWNLRMRDVLVRTQETRGHPAGSWIPRGGHARTGGRLYVTSLAVCCLEVYYRHAPIFRQIKLD